MKNKMSVPVLSGLVAGLLITIIVALNSFTICGVGEECTATAFGKVVQEDITGFEVVPFWYTIGTLNIKDQSWAFNDMGVPAKDKFKTSMDVSFNGKFMSGFGGEITNNVGTPSQFLQTHVDKPMRSCVIKAGTATENSKMFFDEATQRLMAETTKECVNLYLDNIKDTEGAFMVTEVRFSDIRLDTRVEAMIVKTKEREEAEERQASQLRIKDLEAQEVEKVAAANKAAAADNRDAAIFKAEGVKQAMILEAEGNQKLAKSLTPELTAYTLAKLWNGVRSTHVLGRETTYLLK
jgi:regulator of protease activity HflC (stomatin/prohibitin superfamily)